MSGIDTTPPAEGGARSNADPSRSADHAGIHRRITVNSASVFFTYLTALLIAFLLTPFVVRHLGNSDYGFWAVLLSFLGYAGILELGVQTAVVVLVGRHRGTRDPKSLEETLTAAFSFFVVIGALAGLLVVFGMPLLLPKLIRGFHQFERLRLLSALLAVDVFVLFLSYFFTGILYGWQLYHIKNFIDISSWVVNAVIILAFLPRGGLLVLAASKAVTDLVSLLLTTLACRRALPGTRPAFGRLTRRPFRNLFSLGGKVFASALCSRISSNAQPLIISSAISTAANTFFSIPGRLVDYAKQIAWTQTTGFTPLFSELAGGNDTRLIRKLYFQYSRYVLILNLPIIAGLFVYGRSFIQLWIGPEYAERGGTTLCLLTIAAAVEGLQPLFWRLFMGIGRLNLPTVVGASASLLTVMLSLVLVHPMGINGVALSVAILSVASQGFFVWHASRYLEISIWGYFHEILAKPLAIAALFFLVAMTCSLLMGHDSYLKLMGGVAIAALVYAPAAFMSLRRPERDQARRFVRDRLTGGRSAK